VWVTASHGSTSGPKKNKQKKNTKAEEIKTPPVVGAGSSVKVDPKPLKEVKKTNQPKPYKVKTPKTALEILMEDD